jgi:flagellar motor switch/type III secretory pathway protein FliN
MITRDLVWDRQRGLNARIREASFARRCTLPLETVAAAANAIGARLRKLFDCELGVAVLPAVALEDGIWDAICAEARVYPITGGRRDVALVIAADDARRIALRAVGESCDFGSGLSPLETRIVERFVAELVPALDTLCGDARLAPKKRLRPATYAEVRIAAPLEIALGIGVAAEPPPVIGRALPPGALSECYLECSARLGTATLDIFTLSTLAIGDVLRLDAKVGPSATLNLDGNPIAAGEGGVLGGRSAFMVHDVYSGATS